MRNHWKRSALDRPGGDALGDLVPEDKIKDQDGDQSDGQGGKQLPVVRAQGARVAADRIGNSLVLLAGDHQAHEDELIPGAGESDDGQGNGHRSAHGKDDAGKNLDEACPVDPGGLQQLVVDAFDEIRAEIDPHGQPQRDIGNQHRQARIMQLRRAHH